MDNSKRARAAKFLAWQVLLNIIKINSFINISFLLLVKCTCMYVAAGIMANIINAFFQDGFGYRR